MGRRGFAVVLAAATLAHLALAAWLPPADDELYYWCWANPPQLSYYDHPALTAWLIKLSTLILGDTIFAIRLPACLCSLGATALLARLMPRYGLLAAVLLTPVVLFGGILIT